jgi:DNA mismatch repair protein MutS
VGIEIVAGRHPVVELAVASSGQTAQFVPNDVHMSPEQSILVITGPNMSGKSTYLRQVALICLMAQIGSFVPARRARIGLVDRIFTRIGAEDIIHAGQSTFMVEMVETANILHHATPRSLLILDEIGRGTSTYDGLSIAWAVVEHIHNDPGLRARTLFATHYHELTALAGLLPRVVNYNVAVSDEGGRVVFLHKIVPGGADRSYGIHVAQLAGLPRSVIGRAQEILSRLEREDSGAAAALVPRAVRAGGTPGQTGEDVPRVRQLALFADEPHPVVQALRDLDVNSITPLEAISRLYELQRLANHDESRT